MKTKTTLVLTSILLILTGCNMVGGEKIPNQQISDDLQTKSVKMSDGTDWNFGRDSTRCLLISESKFEGDTAKISLAISSQDLSTIESGTIKTMSGTADLNYKKDAAGKWTLETVAAKDLAIKEAAAKDVEPGGKWFEATKAICKNFMDNRILKR